MGVNNPLIRPYFLGGGGGIGGVPLDSHDNIKHVDKKKNIFQSSELKKRQWGEATVVGQLIGLNFFGVSGAPNIFVQSIVSSLKEKIITIQIPKTTTPPKPLLK